MTRSLTSVSSIHKCWLEIKWFWKLIFFIFSKTLIDYSNSTLNDTMKYFSLLKKIMHVCLTDCHNSRNGNFDSFCYQTQFKSYTLLTRCKWTNLIKSVKAVGTFRQLIPFIVLILRLLRVSHKDECWPCMKYFLESNLRFVWEIDN